LINLRTKRFSIVCFDGDLTSTNDPHPIVLTSLASENAMAEINVFQFGNTLVYLEAIRLQLLAIPGPEKDESYDLPR